MKHGKRPTLKQKAIIKNAGYNPNNWLVTKNLANEIHLVHRSTSRERKIPIVS